MPCPPSWEELQMMQIDRDLADVDRAIAKTLPHLRDSLALVETYKPAPIEDFETCVAFAREVSDGEPAYPGKRGGSGWPSQDDIDAEWSYVEFRRQLAKRIELCLCVLGTALARHVRATGIATTPGMETVLQRHREHREREREERAKWFERGGNVEAARKVRAVDVEALCTDRTAEYIA